MVIYACAHGRYLFHIKMAPKKRSGISGQCMVLRWMSAVDQAQCSARRSERAAEAAERRARKARMRELQLRQINAKLLQSSAELRQRAGASERRARKAEASILASAEAWAQEQDST